MKKNSVISTIFSKAIGILVFLILLAIAKVLTNYIEVPVYTIVINFLFQTLDLALIIFFFFLVSEIFWEFKFPFILPAPLLSAGLSYFIIRYIYKMFLMLKALTNFELELPIQLIYLISFIGVIIIGYSVVIKRAIREKNEPEEEKKKEGEKEEIEWKDVGKQFKMFLFKTGKNLNNPKEKNKAKKKKGKVNEKKTEEKKENTSDKAKPSESSQKS